MKNVQYIVCCLVTGVLVSCGNGFLDIKPDQRQRVPKTLEDYQGLLDNTTNFNLASSHALGMIGSDEYYITDAQYESFSSGVDFGYQKNAYTWNSVVYQGGENALIDWNIGFYRILNCNVVLGGLADMEVNGADRDQFNSVKGTALFHRALNLYNLAQLYCPVYSRESANTSVGLPLRKGFDVNERVPRSNLQQTYDAIIGDLKEAEALLPKAPEVIFRPGKAAVYALFARLYLQMDEFDEAMSFAVRALEINDNLLDYNDYSVTWNYIFPINGDGNEEIIFYNSLYSHVSIIASFSCYPDSALLAGYDAGDLRRDLYFLRDFLSNEPFVGSYTGNDNYFTGFATDELYLIKAECEARSGLVNESMETLNHLRRHRFSATAFEPLETDNKDDAMAWILGERRKELYMRGNRWEDIRRLNKEEKYQTTLTRRIGERVYTLAPNSQGYVWPLPLEAIQYGGY